MLKERRVELADFIAQDGVLDEQQSIDILRSRATFAVFVQAVRNAARRHEDFQDLNGIERGCGLARTARFRPS